MATDVNNIADFARILREHPEWADTVRGILIGQDLLELPQRFAKFVESQTEVNRQFSEFMESQSEVNRQFNEFMESQRETNRQLTEAILDNNKRLDRLESSAEELKTGQAEIIERVSGLESDVAELKSGQSILIGRVGGLESDVAELKSGQSVLIGRADQLDNRVSRVEGKVDQLDHRMGRVEGKVDQLDHRMGRVEGKVDQLDHRMGRVEDKVDQLDHRVGRVEGKVDQLDHRMGRVEGKVDQLNHRMGRVEGRVSNLDGSNYERKVASQIIIRIAGLFSVEQPTILFWSYGEPTPKFNSMAQIALNSGRIDSDKLEELLRADFIVTCESGTHFVCEASVNADEDDVWRSVERAAIFAEVTEAEVRPLVVTTSITEEYRQFASSQGVEVIGVQYR